MFTPSFIVILGPQVSLPVVQKDCSPFNAVGFNFAILYEQQMIPYEASGKCNYVHTLRVALPVNSIIYMTALCESLITCLIPKLRIQEQFFQFLLFVFNITVH